MAEPILSDRDFFKLFEFVLIPSVVFGFLAWQILSVRASIRADRQKEERERALRAEPPSGPAGHADG